MSQLQRFWCCERAQHDLAKSPLGLVGDLSRVGPERLVPETLPFAAPRSFGPGGAIGISTSLSISAMAKASPMLAAKSIGSLGLGP